MVLKSCPKKSSSVELHLCLGLACPEAQQGDPSEGQQNPWVIKVAAPGSPDLSLTMGAGLWQNAFGVFLGE